MFKNYVDHETPDQKIKLNYNKADWVKYQCELINLSVELTSDLETLNEKII